MSELLSALSSYNLFNLLLPGVLFAAFSEKITIYRFIQEDLIVGLFTYYFIGMIINRLGSLFISPFLKKISFVTFAPYKDFVKASSKNAKIEVLSEVNNTYISFCALFVSLGILKFYEALDVRFDIVKSLTYWILPILGTILFAYSYKQQTKYIKERVEEELR
jgi:hypothetical protein